MNSKVEAESTRLDSVKWLAVVLLVAAGVGGNIYFANQSLLYRVLALLVLAALTVFIFLQTSKGAEFWKLVKEAKVEIRKVVWPTRQETMQTTLIVVGFVLLMALVLWGLDTLVGWAASRILGLG
jgi:preprotein translocase subunit SecE